MGRPLSKRWDTFIGLPVGDVVARFRPAVRDARSAGLVCVVMANTVWHGRITPSAPGFRP